MCAPGSEAWTQRRLVLVLGAAIAWVTRTLVGNVVSYEIECGIGGETDYLATRTFTGHALMKWQAPYGDACLEIDAAQDFVSRLVARLHL
jgi:hypothetical protein